MKILRLLLTRLAVNPFVFFSIPLLLTLLQTHFVAKALRFGAGEIYPFLWLGGFMALAFNVSLIFTQSFYACFTQGPILPEADREGLGDIPVALVVCVKNEGEDTLDRIRYSLRGNLGTRVHFWLLSDSDASFVEKEKQWVKRLQEEFGNSIYYHWRPEPYERKQGNLAGWFENFGTGYRYFFVLDADSIIPRGMVFTLLRKAEHPEAQDIGIFQSAVYIVHDHSLFARANAIGQYYAQRLYFRVNQAVFGRSISFGHNCLIRSQAFCKIRLPSGILSHDNWDAAIADREGYRTVFVPDTLTFEEATQNYLEERARMKRWMKGSLQGWPILFMSGISFATRWFIFYQIYLYLIHPILLLWILLGLLCGSKWFGMPLFVGEPPGTVHPLVPVLVFTILVLYGHKFLLGRSLSDLKRIAFEVLVSTLVSLNNVFYTTLDFFSLPFEKLSWRPMTKDPNATISFVSCARELFWGTAFGFTVLLWGMFYSPFWILTGLPLLMSLILSIPAVYITSKNLVWDSEGRVKNKIQPEGASPDGHYQGSFAGTKIQPRFI